jgi:hypothetical protein
VRHLLAGELIKVRTTRTALGFGLASVLLVVAGVVISLLTGDYRTVADKRSVLNFGGGVALVLLIFGAVGATGEFRHRTLAPAVLIAPDRARLVLARVGAYSLTALVFGAVMAVVALALGVPLLGREPGPDLGAGDYAAVALGGVLATALATAVGVGVGTIVKNQVGAVVGVLAWVTIVEPLLGLIDDRIFDHGFGAASNSLGQGGDDTLPMGEATLTLVAWTAVLCAAALAVDRRRDVE